MLAPDVADHWRPRTPVARVLQEAPAEAFSPAERVTPLRRPPNFQPAVQRWSFQVPPGQPQFRMAVFGAEAPNESALNDHPLLKWSEQFLASHPDGPHCHQHARSRTLYGTSTHIISAYWVDEDRFDRWTRDQAAEAWWQDPDPAGRHFRELARNSACSSRAAGEPVLARLSDRRFSQRRCRPLPDALLRILWRDARPADRRSE